MWILSEAINEQLLVDAGFTGNHVIKPFKDMLQNLERTEFTSWFRFHSYTSKMDEREQRRREQYMKSLESFRTNAVEITSKMRDWCEDNPERKPLVDEILHSIFFLGKIINCRFAPNDIFNVDEVRENLEKNYPRPFQCYLTQLPKRGPFSCVLDMVVQLKGQANEEEIKQSLRKLYSSLKGKEPKRLSSSTICVSQKSKTSERHYGVSMSNSVPNPRKILIPASCLSTWHEYVAGAVMTYYPEEERKSYFDGTITLPPHVRCQAFSVSNGEEKRPCRSCGNLFGLNTDENMVWPYGNCAEAESLSNLLKREEDVRMEARPNSPLYTEGNRNIARQSVYDELRKVLEEVKFDWDGNFYNPVTTV